MKLLVLLTTLLGIAVCPALADEELCVGRCQEGFNVTRKCQCDPMCTYYQSCCFDYITTCKSKVTRGDVFALPEDEYYSEVFGEGTEFPFLMTSLVLETDPVETDPMGTDPVETDPMGTDPVKTDPMEMDPMGTDLVEMNPMETDPMETKPVPTEVPVQESTEPVAEIQQPLPDLSSTESSVSDSKPPLNDKEPSLGEEEKDNVCSKKPFDAFTDLKNGSIYAFRGNYFYELDDTRVLDGYPKLIQDVWGIQGPIDAAFTRINCQGKTYLFKGRQYWRFDNGVLDPNFPQNISYGFDNIPDSIDAAFALPAKNYHTSEKVYFFKGSRYWEYNFKKQPSPQDCQNSPPSQVFDQYALLQMEDAVDQFFQHLNGNAKSSVSSRPQYIGQGWKGLPDNVDAAVAGRIYLSQSPKTPSRKNHRRKSRRNRRKYQLRKRKASWFSFLDWMSEEDDDSDMDPDWLMPIAPSCQLIQSVYFFKKDKYYRVNLNTKRVDQVYPRYPRPIAQYWLGCRGLDRLK